MMGGGGTAAGLIAGGRVCWTGGGAGAAGATSRTVGSRGFTDVGDFGSLDGSVGGGVVPVARTGVEDAGRTMAGRGSGGAGAMGRSSIRVEVVTRDVLSLREASICASRAAMSLACAS